MCTSVIFFGKRFPAIVHIRIIRHFLHSWYRAYRQVIFSSTKGFCVVWCLGNLDNSDQRHQEALTHLGCSSTKTLLGKTPKSCQCMRVGKGFGKARQWDGMRRSISLNTFEPAYADFFVYLRGFLLISKCSIRCDICPCIEMGSVVMKRTSKCILYRR